MRHIVLLVISAAFLIFCLTQMAGAVSTPDPHAVESSTVHEQPGNGESPAIRASKEAYVENWEMSKNSSPTRSKLSSDLVKLLEKSEKSSDQSVSPYVFASMNSMVFRRNKELQDLVSVYLHLDPSVSAWHLSSHVEEITEWNDAAHVAVAWVKVSDLDVLASIDGIQSIQTVTPPEGRIESGGGATITEGCWLHGISPLIALVNRYGENIKVGVVAIGIDNLTEAQDAREVPRNVTVLKKIADREISRNEGTMMLEIVHEVAPYAELYFHDAGSSQLSFLDAVHALADAGCDVIVDDVGFYDMPYFEDGYAARDISRLIENDGIIYVSAAGNDAQAHYQGTFYSDVSHGNPDFHDFSGGRSNSTDLLFEIPPLDFIKVIVQWDDKWGESGNDYDLELVEVLGKTSTGGYRYGDLLDYSDTIQSGSGEPVESVTYVNWDMYNTTNASLWIEDYNGSAAPRNLELFIFSFPDPQDRDDLAEFLVSGDSIFGQAAITDAITVGALDASTLNNTTVQDTRYLEESIEPYSSRGPVTIAHPVPERRLKPDIMSFDDIVVMGPDGSEKVFPGTSAAAPHIAGFIAALWSEYPGDNATQIKERLYQSAIDIGEPGLDAASGRGLPVWPSDSPSGSQTSVSTSSPLVTATPTPGSTTTVNVSVTPATPTTTIVDDGTTASTTPSPTATTPSVVHSKRPAGDPAISSTTGYGDEGGIP